MAAAESGQASGNETITLSVEALRDVAQRLLSTTGEQLIQQAIEGVKDAGEEIHQALQAQSSACFDAAEFLESFANRNHEGTTSPQRLQREIRELSRDAKRLGQDVGHIDPPSQPSGR